MLGRKDISKQIEEPLAYRSFQRENNFHKALSRSATLRTALRPLFDGDYTDESSNRIALCFERYVKNTRNFIKETSGFVRELRLQILYLHNFNKKVAEVS
ncbi:unnamed protein product [Acanthoscelides obtectus]|uniref:Uncharacterized protein n=1 Tax=Acanthoscelides obtectus TaxID=200917 RepID=A0A9P0NYF0_ACAOB|nr:unnamed protein product [Acanthoscelides obtectus]CAK1654110.1 hypothetical protein AOBTE_LOCUS18454 [Acanthoscelides obtectus]